jgi:DNA replication protein DnaC
MEAKAPSPSEPANGTTPTSAAPGRLAGDLAKLDAIVKERRANQPPREDEPETLGSLVERMLADIPPPLTPEEAEQQRQRSAEARARHEAAQRMSAWRSLVAERGSRYEGCTLASYQCTHPGQTEVRDALRKYAEQMPDRVAEGTGIVLYGPAGTGKDHLLAAMMQAAIRKYGMRVRWENGMDLFGEIRDRIDEEKSEAQWVRSLAYPQILAISDPLPPFGALKEFQASMLFRVIDRRYSEGKPTWLTMNARDRSEAEARMGVQMIDRLAHGALVLFCNWPSWRKK